MGRDHSMWEPPQYTKLVLKDYLKSNKVANSWNSPPATATHKATDNSISCDSEVTFLCYVLSDGPSPSESWLWLWIQLQRWLQWPQLQKAWKENTWPETDEGVRWVEQKKKGLFFWMDGRKVEEPWPWSCISLFLCALEEGRGRDRKVDVIHL